MRDRFDLENEVQIAEMFIKIQGGTFQTFKEDPFAPFDRLWKIGHSYIFIECRQRSRKWDGLEHFGSVFVNVNKLDNVFIFVVRDMANEIRYAKIGPRRLVTLRELPIHDEPDQGGTLQKVVDVPYGWFEKLENKA